MSATRSRLGGCLVALAGVVVGLSTGVAREDSPAVVRLPAGTFTMGCVVGDSSCESYELPRHEVRLSRPFYLDRREVTVEAFRRFAAATGHRTAGERSGRGRDWNPATGEWEWMPGLTYRAPFKGGEPALPAWPALQVSWDDARSYCAWAGGRLPTEAEWEYAARGGRSGEKFPWGDAPTPKIGSTRYANGPDRQTAAAKPRWEIFAEYDDGYAAVAPVGMWA